MRGRVSINIGAPRLKPDPLLTRVSLWSSYWKNCEATTMREEGFNLIVLNFTEPAPEIGISDISVFVNMMGASEFIEFTIDTLDFYEEDNLYALIVDGNFNYGDIIKVIHKESGDSINVTNEILYRVEIGAPTDTEVTTATFRLKINDTVTLNTYGDVLFDKLENPDTWVLAYKPTVIDIPLIITGNGGIYFDNPLAIIELGNVYDDWFCFESPDGGATLSCMISKLTSLQHFYIGARGTVIAHPALPANLISFTEDNCDSVSVFGALPVDLEVFALVSDAVTWEHNGALPDNLSVLILISIGTELKWTYDGALPDSLTIIILQGDFINWTGLDIGDEGNISNDLQLVKFRTSKMSSSDMITLLTQLTNRTGSLPEEITINDYADYEDPPLAVLDAVTALKTAKSVGTVNLGY